MRCFKLVTGTEYMQCVTYGSVTVMWMTTSLELQARTIRVLLVPPQLLRTSVMDEMASDANEDMECSEPVLDADGINNVSSFWAQVSSKQQTYVCQISACRNGRFEPSHF